MSDSDSSSKKTIFVTCATGRQGSAVISALLALPGQPFRILAQTRSARSAAAQRLTRLYPSPSQLTLLEAPLSTPTEIFTPGRQIWGVYCVLVNGPDEEALGKGIIDAALASKTVRHFVYASGDRGGPDKSERDPTFVANFAAKFNTEKHLTHRCAASATSSPVMTYTILRPVTFLENLTADTAGRGFARMWAQMNPSTKPLQLVSVRDVGWFGAQALRSSLAGGPFPFPSALSLAGDELTQPQAAAIYKEVFEGRQEMPLAPCLVGKAVKVVMKSTVGDMFRWFEEEGYAADVEMCRRLRREKDGGAGGGEMLDYRAWLLLQRQQQSRQGQQEKGKGKGPGA